MSEILAPAGDKNSLLAAINSGADAVYLGLKEFSARSSAENFDLENFKEVSDICHAFGVKVYVAMNTLVKDEELENFIADLVGVWNAGADAIIIADVFLGGFIKKNYPEIVLHLSTQAGVCNKYGALFAKEMGFDRVILSRETKLNDLKSIAEIIETEVFVQGALCTCFSGQCYLSSFAGGNSGNRGKCKQPCRKLYSVDRDGFTQNSYKLSLSDLSVGEDIEKLVSAGVFSFKIEGRMRRPEYVAAAVSYYKEILNGDYADIKTLKRTYNRGNYTKGLAFGQDKSFISPLVQGHIGDFIGVIQVLNGKYFCRTKEKFTKNDYFKILREGREVGSGIFAENAKDGFYISSRQRLKNGDKLFITTDSALNSALLNRERKIAVTVKAEFIAENYAKIDLNGITFKGETLLQRAQNRPLTEEEIKNCFNKVDKYPFEIKFGNIKTENVFISASELNALRRKAYFEYFTEISSVNRVQYKVKPLIPPLKTAKNDKIAVICDNLTGLKADIGILKLHNFEDVDFSVSGFHGEKYLFLPPFLTGEEIDKVINLSDKFDGIYCDGIYGFKLSRELKKPLFAGFGLNISNRIAVELCPAEYICLSKELTVREAEKINIENTFYLSLGNVKVMDLIYCPFEKKCKSCDKRRKYALTDENGRKFTLRRYVAGECRFELFNCADIVSPLNNCGLFIDSTLQNPEKILQNCKNEENLRKILKNYTRGHSSLPIN